MKLWIASSTLAFFVFIVFFARQFPKYNWLFAAWLLVNVAAQLAFALLAALDATKNIPDLVVDSIGWGLLGVALIAASRRADAVNEIIFTAFIGQIVLHAVSLALIYVYRAPAPARTLISNVACFAPLGYMLVRFSTVHSDWLRSVAGVRDWGLGVRAAMGFARAILG